MRSNAVQKEEESEHENEHRVEERWTKLLFGAFLLLFTLCVVQAQHHQPPAAAAAKLQMNIICPCTEFIGFGHFVHVHRRRLCTHIRCIRFDCQVRCMRYIFAIGYMHRKSCEPNEITISVIWHSFGRH